MSTEKSLQHIFTVAQKFAACTVVKHADKGEIPWPQRKTSLSDLQKWKDNKRSGGKQQHPGSMTTVIQCQAYQIMLYLLTNHEVCYQDDFSGLF